MKAVVGGSVIVKSSIHRPVILCCVAMLLTSHNLGSPLSLRIEFGCSVYPIPIRHPVTISASLVDCRAAVVSYLLLTEAAEGLLLLNLDISILRLRCDVRILQSSVTWLSII